MQSTNCDVSPMKDQLKQHLNYIAAEIEHSLQLLDAEAHCLLNEFEKVREAFNTVESLAASFYLQCYLSSFTSSYSELAISIRHLSERRHGALIVIQRKDNLNAFIHSGISIEGTLSHSLLESIFYPGNRLHDGAVWIKSDRIISAANILPVSALLVEEDKKMGTRHRAAIGLTERTDALVLIVSEETGNASFAYQGKLHPLNAMGSVVELAEATQYMDMEII
ncbi:sporulation-specific diadenylate cyclase CdaS [Paenibacillus radicis (ex Xue et al. 2023)]|uniref:Diadenylate cyclase n=1 Tax=Paenibacillus radicis (ex Xue et al. 2023) TaxID=2972489 RepID=A0ABT1YT79_9BACL|nr:sporulation-specific diadenylate cyclase CdaS [Paenibacillus radicis (ex Xue et al. 2023)]MCR8635549.1 sporulation-specific diadenylate cyclase CdaS [Paenibacillus radicis (ex Xue et al. 2023)]